MNLQKLFYSKFILQNWRPPKLAALGGCLVCLMDEPDLLGAYQRLNFIAKQLYAENSPNSRKL